MRAQARPLRPKCTEFTIVCQIYKMYQMCKMAQSERGGLDFGRAKPAGPSARARARARARYLKKPRRPFSPDGKPRTKNRNLLLMCAQWTNLGGVIFILFEKLDVLKNIFWSWGGLEEDCDQQSGAGVGSRS